MSLTTKKRVAAALTCLFDWTRDSNQPGGFAAAELNGVVIVIAREGHAHELRQWVYERNGKPQRLKSLYDIRATTKREDAA